MKYMSVALFMLAGCASAQPVETAAPAPAASDDTVQVMVLGVYHFANPGLDLVNTEADDVLTAKRQTELKALASRLAEFQPTAIAIERQRPADSLMDPGFASYTPAMLSEKRNETVQIGYRVAGQLGLDRVYAIDEGEGEIPFFPFDRVLAFAERTGQTQVIDNMLAKVQASATAQEEAQKSETISQLLADHNRPETIQSEHEDYYYSLLKLSDAEDHAGAALNYGWYARNAEIFSNLTEAAEPGDRILVIYGAGHNYWLRHFIQNTPGYELIETLPYLED